jgi:hypothetical protein
MDNNAGGLAWEITVDLWRAGTPQHVIELTVPAATLHQIAKMPVGRVRKVAGEYARLVLQEPAISAGEEVRVLFFFPRATRSTLAFAFRK